MFFGTGLILISLFLTSCFAYASTLFLNLICELKAVSYFIQQI